MSRRTIAAQRRQILAFALVSLVSLVASASVQAGCQRTLEQIAASLPKISDPILHFRRLDAALTACGDTHSMDLLIDRRALAIPLSARRIGDLQGTWVSDIWLTVERGLSFAVADVLTVSGTAVRQAMIWWWDPTRRDNDRRMPNYVVPLGHAELAINKKGHVAATGFKAVANDTGYSPYFPAQTTPAMRMKHAMVSFSMIDLSRISTIRVSGDHLLLVDAPGKVRSYTRYQPDDVRGAHMFFVVGAVSAARHWRCFLRAITGRAGNAQTQATLREAAKTAIELADMQKAIFELGPQDKLSATNGLPKLRRLMAAKARLSQSAAFQTAIGLFQAETRPAFCADTQ